MSFDSNNISFSEGQIMKISVVPASDCPTFSINIGRNKNNFALHFNPRFGKGTTLCNTLTNGGWGEELWVNHLPFVRGAENKITIQFTRQNFRIHLPDNKYIDFPNRFGDAKYTHFEVRGPARITNREIN